ncbi:hypothetical protein ACWT_3577 [Actinoplanes sp. SE50]|uniref:hypothetical protein n=1 Tax=unclassified Actinoplanes TaxID=2626549 RepID=UPI00023EC0EA|nr:MULTISPECIES: hypothetical protein [unclassified Actinoplanes]AEV84600.1 hypothetical protein ACPL_3705 [Actinoplanes sp. SE50/110]ATO82992.1 hypothetical protein ACWT_3577 [Actinoplanes sp. SE50]SLM00400.1 hypothetical protein ACSP50_3632 [Actinoplanes sp. SE50/110]
MPFTRVAAKLEVTPDLVLQDVPDGGGARMLLTADRKMLQFPWRGTDHAGQDTDFQAPAVFVPLGPNARRAPADDPLDPLTRWYEGNAEACTAAVGGLPISVAPADDPAATRLTVHTMSLGGKHLPGVAFPRVQDFTVEMPQLAAITGAPQSVGARFNYFSGYLQQGFKDNGGEVFLRMADKVVPELAVPGAMTGVATPQMAISGLSRSLGPVAGPLSDVANQKLDPAAILKDGARLLGDLRLIDVLAKPAGRANPEQAMKITTRDLPDGAETTLHWAPKLTDFAILKVNPASSLVLDIRIAARLGHPPTHDMRGTLSDVTLNFFTDDDPFIAVQVKTLRFTDSSGAKPDVHCDIGEVTFGGPLRFVRELATLIGFGRGNGVSVVPAGDRVTVALDVAVPSLAIGLLAISNIAVHVGLLLPFNGDPVVFDAGFATREHKFVLGVGILRGGGYAGVKISASGLQSLEFAFEFGAGVSIDLGVASGCVEVMAGIYFKLTATGDRQNIELTAYLRIRGSVSVLGLITVTVEFYLGLTYDSDGDRLTGEATMTVSIDLFLFSTSVSITCRRELTRSSSSFGRTAPAIASAPIRFGDVFTPDLWAQHCAAFA